MVRFPIDYKQHRRSMYVSNAWEAHSVFTPEEVAHVTMLNNRVVELTKNSLDDALAEALRVRQRYEKRKSACLRRYIIKGSVSLGLRMMDTLKSCHDLCYTAEDGTYYHTGCKYCLSDMLRTYRQVITVVLHDNHFSKGEEQLRSETADWRRTMLESDVDLDDNWKELRQQHHLSICWPFIDLMEDFTMDEIMRITPDLFSQHVEL